MNERIKKLMEKRAKALADARAILNKADAEGRSLTAEEQTQYDAFDHEIDSLNADIEREERLCEREASAARSANGARNPAMDRQPGAPEHNNEAEERAAQESMNRYMYNGALDERARFDPYGQREARTIGGVNLSEGSGASGGYLAPVKLERALMDSVTELNFMRKICTVRSSTSDIDLPYVSTHVAAAFVAEGGAISPSDPAFAKKPFKAYKAVALTKVTYEAMQDVFIDVAQWMRDEYGDAFAALEEQVFLTGTGSGEPTGVFAASGGAENGVTAAAAAAITADELFDLVHSVPSKYRQNGKCSFVMNDKTLKLIRKLKAQGTGDYLLQSGIRAGEPDTILGYKVYTSSNVAEATTGNKAIAFGDFKKYIIMDRSGLYVQRLNELYAGNGQVGFLAYRRFDGKLVDTSAIKVLTMA